MKNSGCPDIESASCRFLSKAVDDVKCLPSELDHLKKCEEEIETLKSERDKKVSGKQEEIQSIGYDPERLKVLLEYDRVCREILERCGKIWMQKKQNDGRRNSSAIKSR